MGGSVVKNPPAKAGDAGDVGLIPAQKKWQSISGFLPGKSHGQRNLEGYCPWDHKESDTTE